MIAFLVFGPMVDIKNLLMMKRYFNMRFIASMVGLVALVVIIYAWVCKNDKIFNFDRLCLVDDVFANQWQA